MDSSPASIHSEFSSDDRAHQALRMSGPGRMIGGTGISVIPTGTTGNGRLSEGLEGEDDEGPDDLVSSFL